jgi:hypothetical protein
VGLSLEVVRASSSLHTERDLVTAGHLDTQMGERPEGTCPIT